MSQDDANETPDMSAGIFMWEISRNIVHADYAAAFLFGLDPAAARAGLPIERFIERVHEADRPKLAEEISEAMKTAGPYQSQYRVSATSKVWVEVMAFGHCFQDDAGDLQHFTGIVHPVPVDTSERGPIWHLMAAHELYRQDGDDEQADLVLDLLKQLTNPGKNPLKIRLS